MNHANIRRMINLMKLNSEEEEELAEEEKAALQKSQTKENTTWLGVFDSGK